MDDGLSTWTTVREKDVVVLSAPKNCHLIKAGDGRKRISQIGVFNTSSLVGREYGDTQRLGPNIFTILKPTLPLLHRAFRRKAQVITLKDAITIVGELGIRSGSNVLEVGVGSGFMTAVLLWFIGSGGELISYERRKDFAEIAEENIRSAALDGNWSLKVSPGEEIDEKDRFDCAVVDVPEPWSLMENVGNALLRGGKAAFYMPTYNQFETCLRAFGDAGLSKTGAREVLVRDMTTTEGSIRPCFDMLGHTGFLLFARKR
ncbi:MAG: hypothetical protein QGH39_09535 [Candidatus Thermoplasmatota archaeon]|jgi:tRNA (adenine57-N1/adenine58-N1)-methyltransferase|nr:hypothetical protein [Candidatus Thermoplasmatota archaeon]MDP7265783.1 hypothetical protein [Candidatus Thermoplasmatota archaeon]MDP7422199.1 hypothetical protein [bacterium]